MSIVALEPDSKPVLDGKDTVQILSIDNDANGDNAGDTSLVQIQSLIFQNGKAGGSGGALFIKTGEAAVIVDTCEFSQNFTSAWGGGVYITSHTADISLSGNVFSGNTGHYGGGVYSNSYSGTAALTNNTFSNNHANRGGGAFVTFEKFGEVALGGNSFDGNIADNQGGGLWIYAVNSATLNANTFVDNQTQNGGGGAMVVVGSGHATLTNNILDGNIAFSGAGVYVDAVSGTVISITNNTFTKNHANFSSAGGAYVRLSDDAAADIYNNIFWANIAEGTADDVYIWADADGDGTGSIVRLYNNDFSGNAVFAEDSDSNPGNGILESEDLYITDTDNYHYGRNIQQDPMFVDASSGDFHIRRGSPCINKGTSLASELPETDFEGDSRTIGSAPDMGADESLRGGSGATPWLQLLLDAN
ncbi:MAG: hypothetical protein JRJ12_13410 [Deltaproteobacteria bacterium]|nr:hypothetical protein [Deltaproteobacteria bacterium]